MSNETKSQKAQVIPLPVPDPASLPLAINMLIAAVSANTEELRTVSTSVSDLNGKIERLWEHKTEVDARIVKVEEQLNAVHEDEKNQLKEELDRLRERSDEAEREVFAAAEAEKKTKRDRRNYWIGIVVTFCLGVATQPVTSFIIGLL